MKMITLNTSSGVIHINPDDIAMIRIPSLFHFITLRGYGSVITLKFGQRIHVEEDIQTVKNAVENENLLCK